jgi:recombinational DNA repair protein (RecF pathway)
MPYDIELMQGDSASVAIVLKENGIGVDLTGCTVTFSMINDISTVEHDIVCQPEAVINAGTPSEETVPFTATHTATDGLYFASITKNLFGEQSTFPNTGYITIKINKSVLNE